MSIVMTVVTVYLELTLPSSPSTLEVHVHDDALRWTIALAGHFAVSVLLLGFLRCRGRKLGLFTSYEPTNDCHALLVHAFFTAWFTLWLATLTFLSVTNKFRRFEVEGPAAATPAGLAMLSEHARASNNSTALIALVSLGCFMRAFKLSYVQSVLVGCLMIAATMVTWLLQPGEVALNAQPVSGWTNLVWVVLAVLTEVGHECAK